MNGQACSCSSLDCLSNGCRIVRDKAQADSQKWDFIRQMPPYKPFEPQPMQPKPDDGRTRVFTPLTEADVRRIFREEFERAMRNGDAPSEMDAAPRDSMFSPL